MVDVGTMWSGHVPITHILLLMFSNPHFHFNVFQHFDVVEPTFGDKSILRIGMSMRINMQISRSYRWLFTSFYLIKK